MEIELIPDPGDQIRAVVVRALELAEVKPVPVPVSHESAWRRAAFAEGVQRDADDSPAFSNVAAGASSRAA